MPGEFSFYKDVIVPLLSAVIGGVFVLLVVIYFEKFRKLALWEPYAKALWDQQVPLCCDILGIANKAIGAAVYCSEVFNPNAQNRDRYWEELDKQLIALQNLKGNRLALCTSNFNQSVESLTQQLLVVLEQYPAKKLDTKVINNMPQLWFTLVDNTRTELRVERLDAQARAALEEATRRAPPFDPTGNLTLPY